MKRTGTTLGNPNTKKPARGARLTRAVFTLPNYTSDELNWWKTSFPTLKAAKWCIVGQETCPNTGTPHLQGAFTLLSQVAFSTLKTWPGLLRAHIERMEGSPADSYAYCTKEDSNAFEWGDHPVSRQGKRSDLLNVVESVKCGRNMRDIADAHGVEVIKYHRGINALRGYLTEDRQRGRLPLILWLFGRTGCGKSLKAFELAESWRSIDDVWCSSGKLQWFPGYDRQRACIFDDFRAKDLVSFNQCLRLTDRYPIFVDIKGGNVSWNAELIIFTSPLSITDTFAVRNEHRPEDINQLLRRVKESGGCEFNLELEYDKFDVECLVGAFKSGAYRALEEETGEITFLSSRVPGTGGPWSRFAEDATGSDVVGQEGQSSDLALRHDQERKESSGGSSPPANWIDAPIGSDRTKPRGDEQNGIHDAPVGKVRRRYLDTSPDVQIHEQEVPVPHDSAARQMLSFDDDLGSTWSHTEHLSRMSDSEVDQCEPPFHARADNSGEGGHESSGSL